MLRKEAILKEIAPTERATKGKNRLSRAMDAYDNGDYTRGIFGKEREI
ncbi:hypothetical protein [Bacillus smithii]|uniref:Uncharacterized protein n=1 Tax=Bacillus smithii 7_3_47FAA TaxID=665952 RepID=G9QQS0_9BACI|nr:hypothetical protein [Bacillus smithii]EHL72389.1 hypothetical protein HMPREF1015_02343 [Bacillus smithii 7_3_47FAA]MED4885077.1 hypothetical protein [Bacillus smithii]MED4928703.1 hypothetical protein [Bacillus smithii]